MGISEKGCNRLATGPHKRTQEAEVGGGRIIGEVCHFVDLLRFLAGREIESSEISRLRSGVGDTVSIQLFFSDESIGTIHYLANGNKSFPKERLEVFCGGRILQCFFVRQDLQDYMDFFVVFSPS